MRMTGKMPVLLARPHDVCAYCRNFGSHRNIASSILAIVSAAGFRQFAGNRILPFAGRRCGRHGLFSFLSKPTQQFTSPRSLELRPAASSRFRTATVHGPGPCSVIRRTAMAPRATTNCENNSRTVPRQAGLPVALSLVSWESQDL
jgi:hypothetical protein